MTLQEAIEARHSVRAYKEQPLTEGVVKIFEEQIALLNRDGNLHIQLIQNEAKDMASKSCFMLLMLPSNILERLSLILRHRSMPEDSMKALDSNSHPRLSCSMVSLTLK